MPIIAKTSLNMLDFFRKFFRFLLGKSQTVLPEEGIITDTQSSKEEDLSDTGTTNQKEPPADQDAGEEQQEPDTGGADQKPDQDNLGDGPSQSTITQTRPEKKPEISTGGEPGVFLIDLVRTQSGPHDTLGKLYLNGKFACHTLENPKKPAGSQGGCIPEGEYEIELRTTGGRHATYLYRFKDMHKGMLSLKSVPEFDHVYIHIGNRASDTQGSILVGTESVDKPENQSREIWYSDRAYQQIYPEIAGKLTTDQRIMIRISSDVSGST